MPVVDAIQATCDWCLEERTFSGEDAEKEWAESGWFIHLQDETQGTFCSVECLTRKLS